MKKGNFVSEVYDNCNSIEYVAEYLEEMSVLLSRMNMDRLSESLNAKALNLHHAALSIRAAASKEIVDTFNAAQASSANMLNALLAGSELAKRESKKSKK